MCEVCKLPFLGLRPEFDPLAFELFTRVGFLCGWIQVCSYFGYSIDQSPEDLEGVCFERNHWRTYLPVPTPRRPATCMTVDNM